MSIDWQKATDTTLIDACLQGEEQAWAMLITRYSRLIYSIPIRFGFPQTIADEIFQETCLALLEGLHTLQNQDRLSSWLMTVSRRSCIRRMRQKSEVEMDEEWETAVPANRNRILIGCGCLLVLACVLCVGTVFFLDSYNHGQLLYCGGLRPFWETTLGPVGFNPACP